MRKPTVSIAMATYNGEKYIREQLDSLYSQTYPHYEIVVVDDKSSDSTLSILEEYHKKRGLIYIKNEHNLGINKTFEKALKNCSGDYVMFCDQDDIWYPNKIEDTLKKMLEIEDDLPAVISSQCIDIDGNGKIIKQQPIKKDTHSIGSNLVGQRHSQGCSLMLNRELINILKPFPSQRPLYDVYVSFIAASCGVKYNIGYPLMKYRHHESNVIAKLKKSNQKKDIKLKTHKKKNFIIPESRFETLRLIKQEYGELFNIKAAKLIDKLIRYENSNIVNKIITIFSVRGITIKDRIKTLFLEIYSRF